VEREISVTVWNKPCKITVYRKYKTVWVASGDYMGESISVKGQTEGAAVKLWIDAATYKGNG
jgi:hypothetical protein